MKTITKLSLLISLVVCLSATAQKTGSSRKSGPLREDNIINTKHEQRKERRVQRASVSSERHAEIYAIKKNRMHHKSRRKKANHEKVAVNKKVKT